MTILKERYELRDKLGEGGMAEVYRAYQLNLDREVAVKFIRTGIANKTFAARFEREAKAIARLQHPNITQVFDFDHDDDGRFFMVMELLRGEDLATRLLRMHGAGQLLPLPEVIRIIRLVAEALHYAHHQGIVHRDVKPHNVFITEDNRVMVMDFGIAKMADAGSLTDTGRVLGTVKYLAPEQLDNTDSDHRVDIYALGVMFYEMLVGRAPFRGHTPAATIMQHIAAPIPDPREARPDLPESISQIMELALAKDPNDRYPDMAALIADLNELDPSQVGPAVYSGEVESAIPMTGEIAAGNGPLVTRDLGQTLTQPIQVNFNLGFLLGLLAVVAVAILAGVLLLAQGDEGSEESDDDGEESSLAITPIADDNLLVTDTRASYLVLFTAIPGAEDSVAEILGQFRSNDLTAVLGDRLELAITETTVTSSSDAEALADESDAHLVIWGQATDEGLELVIQMHDAPENGPQELHVVIPSDTSPSEQETILLTAVAHTLSTGQFIQRNDVEALLTLLTNQPSGAAGTNIIAMDELDGYLVDIGAGMANGDYARVDTAAAQALTLIPDAPQFHLLRWAMNTLYLDDFEQARQEVEMLQSLLGEDSPVYQMAAVATAYYEGDTEAVLMLTDGKVGNSDLGIILGLFRSATLLSQGEFLQASNELAILDTDSVTRVFGAPYNLALLGMLNDFAGIFQSEDTIRALNATSLPGSTLSVLANAPSAPPSLLATTAFMTEFGPQRVNAGLALDLALARYPDDYLLNWRRGRLAQARGDANTALAHFGKAVEEAPVPLVGGYLEMTNIIGQPGAQLEGDIPDPCDLLAEAQTGIEAMPQFYANFQTRLPARLTQHGCA